MRKALCSNVIAEENEYADPRMAFSSFPCSCGLDLSPQDGAACVQGGSSVLIKPL